MTRFFSRHQLKRREVLRRKREKKAAAKERQAFLALVPVASGPKKVGLRRYAEVIDKVEVGGFRDFKAKNAKKSKRKGRRRTWRELGNPELVDVVVDIIEQLL